MRGAIMSALQINARTNSGSYLGLSRNMSPLSMHSCRSCWRCFTWIIAAFSVLSNVNCISPTEEFPKAPTSKPESHRFSDNRYHGGLLYYRYLSLQGGYLYVGAMDAIYRLDASNITQGFTRSSFDDHLILNQTMHVNKLTCKSIGKDSDFDCQNHIRAIVAEPDRNLVWACGSGAFHPQNFFLKFDDLSVDETKLAFMGRRSGDAKCPPDPNDRPVMALVGENSGNANNGAAIYTATVTDYYGANHIFHRPALDLSGTPSVKLSTVPHNPKWLNGPTFIAAFEAGDYVFLFFHEYSFEHQKFGSPVYPRVARVCKNDTGGRGVLEENWTGYLKARLNCSIPGSYPYYFNKLEDVYYQNGDFYGLFTTTDPSNVPRTSAICSFRYNAIVSVFDNGGFLEQLSNDNYWTVVPQSKMTTPRPGICSDSKSIPQHVLQFIMARPLMYEAVPSTINKPLYWARDVSYTRIQVDPFPNYTVIFLATDDGEIHKVGQWTDGVEMKSRLLAIWRPFDENDYPDASHPTIQQMTLKDTTLYVSNDMAVLQMKTSQCQMYPTCTTCIADPYCKWSNRACLDRQQRDSSEARGQDLLQICGNSCSKDRSYSTYVKMFGEALHMNCTSHCDTSGTIAWSKDNVKVEADMKHLFHGDDNSLIILNVTSRDSGVYRCSSEGVTFTQHNITVTDCSDVECVWKRELSNWCAEFEKYQSEMNAWNCMKESCVNTGCLPSKITDQCARGPNA